MNQLEKTEPAKAYVALSNSHRLALILPIFAEQSVKIYVKRVYEAPAPGDGKRVLIDRLWPRGLSKADAKVDIWMKEIAVSTTLRRWYEHDPEKWSEFKKRYHAELDENPNSVGELMSYAATGKLTLLFGSREERLNNAVALKEYLESKARCS